MKNKIITSEGNVQFQTVDGKIINVHPFHVYSLFNEDTVSFLLIAMPKSSGLAVFTSKAEDLEVNGVTYTFEQLPNALSEAFAIAGAQARAEIVDELPETGMTNTIYLVPKPDGQSGFDEYIYLKDEQRWELIGDTSIEFSQYLQKTDFYAYTAETETKINYISGAVDTEEARAISAETALQTAIDNEVSARTDADTALQNAINAEASARTEDVTALSGAIDTEIAAREAADSVISGAVDNVSANLANEVSRAISAETELQTAIGNEASARTEADNILQGNIDIVSGNVITESERAISAETALQTAIDNETSARTDADTYISGTVDTLSSIKADKVNAVASAEYVSSSTTIDLKNISGDVISQVDASDFIIDGFVEDVRIENGYLVIDFNTASGVEDIEIPLTSIFDPNNYYDKNAIDAIVSGINDDIADEVSARTEADNALDGKITYVSGAVDTVSSALTEDERVWGEALNDLNSRINTVSGNALTSGDVQTQIDESISGKQDTLSAGTSIDITNNVISVTGVSVETSSAITSGDTNPVQGGVLYDKFDEIEQVTARAMVDFAEADEVTARALVDLNDRFGGLKLVKITQSAYDALTTKDENTLYIIVN